MDVLKRVLGDWRCLKLRFPFLKKCKENSNALDKYEYYVYKFQSIVIWEHPTQTISCLLLIQLLFWMIVNLCWKFYGILFTLMLVCCTHDVWTEKIWPEIRLPQSDMMYRENFASNSRILTTSQIEEYFSNLLLHAKMTLIRFRNMRSSHPMMFCSVLSISFGLLTVIGCTISGIWLLYMTVMTIFLSPGIYIHLLPESMKKMLKEYKNEFISFLSSLDGADIDEDDEYVPKLTEENLEEAYATVFQGNDGNNEFSSYDNDEFPGLEAIPSFDDSSLDEMDRVDMRADLEFSESSSFSSEDAEVMKFRGEHFDHDDTDSMSNESNEDDEVMVAEEYSEEAVLPDPQYRGTAVSDSSVLTSFVSNLTFPTINQFGRNLFTNIMPSSSTSQSECGLRKRRREEPSTKGNTDDEFEFINESDLN